MPEMKYGPGHCQIQDSCSFDALTIEDGAVLTPPEGHWLTLTVNGDVKPLIPGQYRGEVKLTVSPKFSWESYRFARTELNDFRAGAVIKDGRYLPEYSVPASVQGGFVRDGEAGGVQIYANDWDFNGFYITGTGEYLIHDVKMCLTGDGTDDFCGKGAGIAVSGSAKVTVNNAEIHNFGISRGAAFVGENAEVTFNDCFFTLDSGAYTQQELKERTAGPDRRMIEPPWMMGITGYGRTTNLAGMATANYNRCHIVSNSWGVLSVDGGCVTRLNVKDSLLELTGESGYGVFSIADDVAFDYAAYGKHGSYDTIDHSIIKGVTYPIIMSLGKAGGAFINGTKIYSRWGSLIFRNSGGHLDVNTKAELHTTQSSFLVKGSNSFISVDDAVLDPGNGIILQLQDNDETGMGSSQVDYAIPRGEEDVRDPSRDLFQAVETEDVFMTVSNMTATGDFFNGTTNLYANCRGVQAKDLPDFGQIRGVSGKDLQGAKNLSLCLENAEITGVISAGKTKYNTSLDVITRKDYQELSNVCFEAAPPVNNGVIVSIDKKSTWRITGTCYLTKLTIEEGGRVTGANGKTVSMTVDDVPMKIDSGTYTGMIILKIT